MLRMKIKEEHDAFHDNHPDYHENKLSSQNMLRMMIEEEQNDIIDENHGVILHAENKLLSLNKLRMKIKKMKDDENHGVIHATNKLSSQNMLRMMMEEEQDDDIDENHGVN